LSVLSILSVHLGLDLATEIILLVSAHERPLGNSEDGERGEDESKREFHGWVWMAVVVVVG